VFSAKKYVILEISGGLRKAEKKMLTSVLTIKEASMISLALAGQVKANVNWHRQRTKLYEL